jgi:two-component system LytT family response regulator
MQTYKALVIDDESASRKNTISMLKQYCPEIEVIGEADSGLSGKKSIQELQPHVVFLDIQMPGMNGFQMLEGIYKRDFKVIFVTAYGDHGIAAVKAGATDYLLKPIIISELQQAVNKVVAHYSQMPEKPTDQEPHTIVINHSKGFTLVEFSDIIWLEANDNYTTLYLKSEKKIVASKTLKEFESILPSRDFFRVHRSSLINFACVKEFSTHDGGEVVLENGTRVQVSKARTQDFAAFISERAVRPK